MTVNGTGQVPAPPGRRLSRGEPQAESDPAPRPGAGQALDEVTQILSVTGLRLVRLCARLESADDKLTLGEACDDLDEAIAALRRFALAAQVSPGAPGG